MVKINLKVEHVLILVIIAFVIYHLISRCECAKGVNGFSVGIEESNGSCILQSNAEDIYKGLCSHNITEKRCQDYDRVCVWKDNTGQLSWGNWKDGMRGTGPSHKYIDESAWPYEFFYTIHPDPIYKKEHLGNRNYTLNTIWCHTRDGSCKNVIACTIDSPWKEFFGMRVSKNYSHSYNYLTRITLKDPINSYNMGEFEPLVDCGCITPKDEVGVSSKNDGTPMYSFSKEFLIKYVKSFKTLYKKHSNIPWFVTTEVYNKGQNKLNHMNNLNKLFSYSWTNPVCKSLSTGKEVPFKGDGAKNASNCDDFLWDPDNYIFVDSADPNLLPNYCNGRKVDPNDREVDLPCFYPRDDPEGGCKRGDDEYISR